MTTTLSSNFSVITLRCMKYVSMLETRSYEENYSIFVVVVVSQLMFMNDSVKGYCLVILILKDGGRR